MVMIIVMLTLVVVKVEMFIYLVYTTRNHAKYINAQKLTSDEFQRKEKLTEGRILQEGKVYPHRQECRGILDFIDHNCCSELIQSYEAVTSLKNKNHYKSPG